MNLESVKEEAREIFVEFTNGLCYAMALGKKNIYSLVNDAMRLMWLSGMTSQGVSSIARTNNYGSLYNWYAATDSRIAPTGWHVPSNAEYETLIYDTLPNVSAGNSLKRDGLNKWLSPNTNATNSSGFSAVGSGGRITSTYFQFALLGLRFMSWCTTTSLINGQALTLINVSESAAVSIYAKYCALSMRFIKDDSVNTGTLTDVDGNVYTTVKIGDQVWTAENWICEHFNDGTPIPFVLDADEWLASTSPAMCYYDDDRDNSYAATSIDVIDPIDYDSPTLAIENLRHYRGIFHNVDLSQIGAGTSSSPSAPEVSALIRSGEQDSVIGANAVVFSSPLSTANYTVNVWIIGTDESQYDLGEITKATTGFTVSDAVIVGTLYYQVIVIV